MNLQLALDIKDIDQGLKLVEQLKDYVDIFELGTGFMGSFGYNLVKIFRDAFPDIQILADVKIVDGGYGTSARVFELGANYSTVVGYADVPTLEGAVRAAKEAGPGHYIMADLMHMPDYSVHQPKIDALGIHYVSAHRATDATNTISLEDFFKKLEQTHFKAKVAVAGGITIESLPVLKKYNPDLLIIGGSITRAADPLAAAKAFKEA